MEAKQTDTFNKFKGDEYENRTLKTFPKYEEMFDSIVNAIPDSKNDPSILDFGCGTGFLSLKILKRFPNAKLTCLDVTESMLDMAKEKLEKYPNTIYVNDFSQIKECKFDAIVTSLVMHHVGTKEDIINKYKDFHKLLNDGGVIYVAEMFNQTNPYLDKMIVDLRTKFMEKNNVAEDIKKNTLHRMELHRGKIYTLNENLDFLKQAGFNNLNVIWLYYFCGVFGGN